MLIQMFGVHIWAHKVCFTHAFMNTSAPRQIALWSFFDKGAFSNLVDIILLFLDHPPTPAWTFLLIERGQNWEILDHLPTPLCPRGY